MKTLANIFTNMRQGRRSPLQKIKNTPEQSKRATENFIKAKSKIKAVILKKKQEREIEERLSKEIEEKEVSEEEIKAIREHIRKKVREENVVLSLQRNLVQAKERKQADIGDGAEEVKRIFNMIQDVAEKGNLSDLKSAAGSLLVGKNISAGGSVIAAAFKNYNLFQLGVTISLIMKDKNKRNQFIEEVLNFVVTRSPELIENIIDSILNNEEFQEVLNYNHQGSSFIRLSDKEKLDTLLKLSADDPAFKAKIESNIKKIDIELQKDSSSQKTQDNDKLKNLLVSILNLREGSKTKESIDKLKDDFLMILKINQNSGNILLKNIVKEYISFRRTNNEQDEHKQSLKDLMKRSIEFASNEDIVDVFDDIIKRESVTTKEKSNLSKNVKSFYNYIDADLLDIFFTTITGEAGIIKFIEAYTTDKPLRITEQMENSMNILLQKDITPEQIKQIKEAFNKRRSYNFSNEDIEQLNSILSIKLNKNQIVELQKIFSTRELPLKFNDKQQEAFIETTKKFLIFTRFLGQDFFADQNNKILLENLAKSVDKYKTVKNIKIESIKKDLDNDKLLDDIVTNANLVMNRFVDSIDGILSNKFIDSPDYNKIDLESVFNIKIVLRKIFTDFKPEIDELIKINIEKSLYLSDQTNQFQPLNEKLAILNGKIFAKLVSHDLIRSEEFKKLIKKFSEIPEFSSFLSKNLLMQNIMRLGLIGGIESDLPSKIGKAAVYNEKERQELFQTFLSYNKFTKNKKNREYYTINSRIENNQATDVEKDRFEQMCRNEVPADVLIEEEKIAKNLFNQLKLLSESIDKPLIQNYNELCKAIYNGASREIIAKQFKTLQAELEALGISVEKIDEIKKNIEDDRVDLELTLEKIKECITPNFGITDTLALIDNQAELIGSLKSQEKFFLNLAKMAVPSQAHLFETEKSSDAIDKLSAIFAEKAIKTGFANSFISKLIKEEVKNQELPEKEKRKPNLLEYIKGYVTIESIDDPDIKEMEMKKLSKKIGNYVSSKAALSALTHADYINEIKKDQQKINYLLKEIPDQKVVWGGWLGLNMAYAGNSVVNNATYAYNLVSDIFPKKNDNNKEKIIQK